MQREIDAAIGAAATEVLRREHDLRPERLLQRLAVVFGLQPAADHQAVQAVEVGLGRFHFGHHGAVLHHVNAVAQRQHLVETVRNEHERGPRLQRPHSREQDVDVRLL